MAMFSCKFAVAVYVSAKADCFPAPPSDLRFPCNPPSSSSLLFTSYISEQNMAQPFQTPFPTDLSLSQTFVLKTTRPNAQDTGALSPVPQKPPVRRVYAHRKSLGSASSRNLKENVIYAKPGRSPEEPKLNLRSKLRARRTTSFASLKERRHLKENEASPGHRLSRKTSRASSRRSLASPFSSQPSSPNQGTASPNAEIARSNSKRDRSCALGGHGPAFPEPKRRLSTRSIKSALPSKLRSPRKMLLGDTEAAVSVAPIDLNRRPSHPNLGPKDDMGLFQAGLPAPDFNRPPSQLSIYAPVEAIVGNPLARTDSVSSADLFAADIRAASTPYHAGRVSTLNSAHDGGASSSRLGPSPTLERRDTLDDLTENMSLTSVMEPSAAHNDEIGDRTPWITDSLISPPTIYRKGPMDVEDGDLDPPNQLARATNTLNLDMLSSDSDDPQALPAQNGKWNSTVTL